MKKFYILSLTLVLLLITLCVGCKKEDPLKLSVAELRCNIYTGSSENYELKATYGYNELALSNNTKGDNIYRLTFKLLGKETEQITYSLQFKEDNKTYNENFTFNPVKNSLECQIEIENFSKKEFTVNISSGSDTQSVTLKSILPDNTLSFLDALKCLQKEQPSLIESYKNENGDFGAKRQCTNRVFGF